MDTVLIDTSVWINYLKDNKTKATTYIDNEINNIVIATCPVIVQEILQGVVSDQQFKALEMYFTNLEQLENDPYEMAVNAAKLYRTLRKKGITIRKPNDCLIAAYAIQNNLFLLQNDIDFVPIADNSSLMLVEL